MKEEPAPEGGRACQFCGEDIAVFSHANRKYCSTSCQNKAYRERDPERHAAETKRWRENHPDTRKKLKREHAARIRIIDLRRPLIAAAKARAKKQGVPFDLTVDDIQIPDYCPVLGIPLERAVGQHCHGSPSLDKVVPRVGYVRGNVIVISHRANALKRDATPHEMRLLADFYEKFIREKWLRPSS